MSAESLQLEGDLIFARLPGILAQTEAFTQRADLPDCLSIDLSKVGEVDSSAVALLLRWRREAERLQRRIQFINLPAPLASLAELYGVTDIVQPHSVTGGCAG
jgi:phospholipid transport system transporter-binding protein